jgi:hypothetical protein
MKQLCNKIKQIKSREENPIDPVKQLRPKEIGNETSSIAHHYKNHKK